MVKIKIQIPDHLYREAKRVAHEYEMSFAEVVRRSLERTLPNYPQRDAGEAWSAPEPLNLTLCCRIDDDEWRLLANEPDYVPKRPADLR